MFLLGVPLLIFSFTIYNIVAFLHARLLVVDGGRAVQARLRWR